MASAEKLHALKVILGELESPGKKEFFSASSLPVRLPRGALVELTGNAKAEWVVQFLKENKELKVFWCEEKQSIFPTAISQRGINLERIVFGVFKENLFPSLRKIVQSQVFEIIVSPSSFTEMKLLKALQLFSEKANTTIFLFAKRHQTAWPISLQIEIQPGEGKRNFQISVQKNRYEASGCV